MTTRKATITVSGPVGCGKSIVMQRIAAMMAEEFDVEVESEDLETELRLRPDLADEPTDGELNTIQETEWELIESLDKPN